MLTNGIWLKQQGPQGEKGDKGDQGDAWDGQTPLSELTVNGTSTFNSTIYVDGSVLHADDVSTINIAPGTITNKGGNITLFAENHPVYPKRVQFRNGSAINMLIDDNVIIGSTTDSGQKFQVKQGTNAVGAYFENSYNTVPADRIGFTVNNTAGTEGIILKLRSTGSDRFIVNGSGRTLIGANPVDNGTDLLQVGGSIKSTVASNGTAFKAKADGTVIVSLENNINKTWSFVARSSGATPANGFQILESDVGASMTFFTGGNVGIGTDVDNGDLLQVGSNTDISASIGRAKFHSSFSDFAMFSHIDYADQTNYALAHRNNGNTILNCASGGNVAIWTGGSAGQIAYFSLAEVEFRKNLNGKRLMSSGFEASPSTGNYIQMYYDAGVGNDWGTILAYDYDSAEYRRVRLEGSNILLNATTGNNVIVGSTIDNGTDLLQVGSNSDISVSFGRGKLGYAGGTTDHFIISHYDNFSTTDFALRATTGGTQANAKSGSAFSILNAGTDIVATFSGDQITLLKSTIIGSNTDSGQYFQLKQSASPVGCYIENNYNTVPDDVRGLVVNNIGTTSGELVRLRSGSINRMLILGSGEVLIGNNPIDNGTDLLQIYGTAANNTGVWATLSDERVKTNIRDISDPLQKALDLADCVKHFEYIPEMENNLGIRTQYIAQLLEEKGFADHVTETKPKNEAVGEIFGWEYTDEVTTNEETGEQETSRVVTKEGDLVKQVENNFAPYAFPAIKELYGIIQDLKAEVETLKSCINA